MKVFSINETDWYMAETLEAAVEKAMQDTGLPFDEAVDDPHEVSADEMKRLMFRDDDGTRRTFADELERRVKAGAGPQCFASTEC